jgi:hypothetical protein
MNLKPAINAANSKQHILENQPSYFPRLYFIPTPDTLTQRLCPANDPLFHNPPSPIPLRQHPIQRFNQQRKEHLQRLVADAKTAIIAAFRATVRWLFWHITVPLAVMASLYISFASPAELPM